MVEADFLESTIQNYERSKTTTTCGTGRGAGKREENQYPADAIDGAVGDCVITVDDRPIGDGDLLFFYPVQPSEPGH